MRLTQLREQVLEANLELVRRGLVLYTFGNASGVDREQGLVVIKPSGIDYDKLKPEHMVITDLEGNLVEGTLRPLLRPRHPHPPLSGVLRNRRSRSHALRVCYQLCASRTAHPSIWHHPRGLLPRAGPGHGAPLRRSHPGTVRSRDRRRHRRALSQRREPRRHQSSRSALPASSMGTLPSSGERHRMTPPTTLSCSKRLPAWHTVTLALEGKYAGGVAGPAGSALLSQARCQSHLRTVQGRSTIFDQGDSLSRKTDTLTASLASPCFTQS